MILESLTRALKEQNWLAVAIEFVIVIAGVVLGFQIQAWNEARTDRETERTYLARLHQDMERSTCSLRTDVLMTTTWNERARRTLDALLAKDPDAVDGDGFELVASTRVRTGSLFRATLNELVNGGQVNLISDNALRARIAEADAQFSAHDELIRILVDAQPSFVGDVQSRLRPTPGSVYGITYDFATLAEDEVFINSLGHALRNTHVNGVWLAEMVEIADGLRAAVAEAIGEDAEAIDCDLQETRF